VTPPKVRIPDGAVREVHACIAQARVHMDLAGYVLTKDPQAVPDKLTGAISALTAAREVLALGCEEPDDGDVEVRLALTEVTVRVARTHDRAADIIATVPSGDQYLRPATVVTGSCRRISRDGEPEQWRAYLWPCAGGSMHTTQSCDAIDRKTVDLLGKALGHRLAKEGPWWT